MSTRLDESHDSTLRSWVRSANLPGTDFPIQNLPFGVFTRRATSQPRRIGVAIGDQILDVTLAGANLRDLPVELRAALSLPALNELMALGHDAMRTLRKALVELLRDRGRTDRAEWLVPMAAADMHVPATIGDYTDFFASIHHATRVGRLFRPDHPLAPNYKYVPVAYHGRSSSIVPSGTAIRRPSGQTRSPDDTGPSYRPSRSLDYELEAGILIGRRGEPGRPIDLRDADDHVFGLCLLNDWSARDIQAWESAPLGPFLAKNFATTISPWIVTLEALAPFRCEPAARPPDDPEPLPYLRHRTGTRSQIDMQVGVWITSERMRHAGVPPMRLGRSSLRDLYWDIDQLVTHHASNGCNLRPGDLLGTGTISGGGDESQGCLLELTANGRRPVELPNGETRQFLADGDEVTLRGQCARKGFASIGFGECRGTVTS